MLPIVTQIFNFTHFVTACKLFEGFSGCPCLDSIVCFYNFVIRPKDFTVLTLHSVLYYVISWQSYVNNVMQVGEYG
jgi:hypothetical protein